MGVAEDNDLNIVRCEVSIADHQPIVYALEALNAHIISPHAQQFIRNRVHHRSLQIKAHQLPVCALLRKIEPDFLVRKIKRMGKIGCFIIRKRLGS